MSYSIYKKELGNMWRMSTQEPVEDARNSDLEFILLESTNKTYKYILINGLLGAAAQWHNPLILQKKSSLDRPWDARSVCHNVLVPFERDHMEGKLGNSNEPFLNKPARFPELSKGNAVRSGKDEQVLNALIKLFASLSDQADARRMLRNALRCVRKMPPQKIEATASASGAAIKAALDKLLTHNVEGEILTFCVGLILWSQFDRQKFAISMHPTNQSGASGKEISDIDVLSKDDCSPIACFEVKDKPFTAYDFEHAQGESCGTRRSELHICFPPPVYFGIYEKGSRKFLVA